MAFHLQAKSTRIAILVAVVTVVILGAIGYRVHQNKLTNTTLPPGSTPTPTIAQTGATGVSGHIYIDGGCPVVRSDSPCPNHPYTAQVSLIKQGSSTPLASTTSDSNGSYTIEAPAGYYTLTAKNENGQPVPLAAPVDITILSGKLTEQDMIFDSGIR